MFRDLERRNEIMNEEVIIELWILSLVVYSIYTCLILNMLDNIREELRKIRKEAKPT